MSKAQAGQILSTEIVLEPLAHALRHDPHRAVRGEGKVRAGAGIDRRARPPGRESRITAGCRSWAGRATSAPCWMPWTGLAQGQGRLVEIAGEAGIGKTRLVQEVFARSQRLHGVPCRCEEYEASTPYFPIRPSCATSPRARPCADRTRSRAGCGEVVERADPGLVPVGPAARIPLGMELRRHAGDARARPALPSGAPGRGDVAVPAGRPLTGRRPSS